jgi:hypothetical protein
MNFPGAVAANIAANVTTSSMSLPTARDVGNMVYQALFITGGAYLTSLGIKKVLKWKPADLSKLELDDAAKLTGVLVVSMWGRNWLVTSGYIPNEIFKPPTATAGASSGARAGTS